MVRVGFIGLGRMGRPMCRHILRAGFPLTVYDHKQTAIDELVARGAEGAWSAVEVGTASDVILVMVPTDDDVMEAVAGQSGLLDGAAPGSVIAVCGSTTPELCVRAAAVAREKGVGLVDTPVCRGVRGAEAADLTVYAGGEVEDVEKCRPVFEAFANHVFHMGPIGTGQVTKTVNNLIHWVEVVGIYEALRLGAAHGVHPNKLRPALLAGSVGSRTLRELHLVGLAWPHKDMKNAFRMAAESQTSMPLMERVGELVVNMSKEDLRALFVEDGPA
ncbi:MAG: NAD(P)-dependent oxidoreductase [Anaerolineae bacterium]